ncbi:exonuclease [Roseivivax sp. CAU 1761]
MRRAVVWDCEFLTDAGAPGRFWCGPRDPDPTLVQLGAVRLDLDGGAPRVHDRFEALVVPRDRRGRRVALAPLFTQLTGLTEARLDAEGGPLGAALAAFAAFAGDAPLWAWGKDEFNAVAISCYVAGIAPPIAATRFGNAPLLLERAGVPLERIHALRSHTLAAEFGLDLPQLRGHDAVDDATAVAHVLAHLIGAGRLAPEAVANIDSAAT